MSEKHTAGINGGLDTAQFNIIRASEGITSLLDSGVVRMKPADIESARKYLKTIMSHARKIHLALAEFEMIAPPNKESHE